MPKPPARAKVRRKAGAAGKSTAKVRAKAKVKRPRRSLWSRLVAPLRRLGALLPGRKRKGAAKAKTQGSGKAKGASARALLLGGSDQKRTLAQWKELRRRTTAEVKAHLAEEQPIPAIKKLTRALLEDPQHQAYHELLKKAVELRRRRRLKAGRKDPWADLPKDLRQEALQLEAFSAYVDELEQLFDKAGIPPLAAPPPPEERKGGQGGKPRRRAKAKAVKPKEGKA